MTPTNRFVVNHWLKLSWKFLKHSTGVVLMLKEREGSARRRVQAKSHDNIFMNFLDSTR